MSQRCFLARACALPLAPFECGGVSLLVLVCVPLCGNPVRTECGNVCGIAKIYRPILFPTSPNESHTGQSRSLLGLATAMHVPG